MAAVMAPGGASIRDLVHEIVIGVLGDVEEGSEIYNSAFQAVFMRCSYSIPRREEEATTSDLITAHLMQSGQRDGQGVDGHLRFQGLCRQMRSQPLLKSTALRGSALRMLYMLRSGAERSGQPGSVPAFQAELRAPPTWTAVPADARAGNAGSQASSAPVQGPSGRASASASGPRSTASRRGWNVAGASGRTPASVSEPQLLRDLLHALQGVDSASFRFVQAERRFEASPSLVLSRPAWALTQKVLELGSLHARLCAATNSALEAESGNSLLLQALCEALRGQLRDYYKVLALLMAKAETPGSVAADGSDVPELTLRRLWAWLQEPAQRMRLLVVLCEACQPLRGGALASAVYGFSRNGDSVAREACEAILRRVAEPLLAMVRAWMTEGELRDPFGEFFVCANSSVDLQDLWQRMYSLDVDMVPCFVTLELARKILLTGKSVNFIRLCCPGQDWLPASARSQQSPLAQPDDLHSSADLAMADDGAQTPKGLPLADLSARVEQAASQTNQHLVSLMMKQYCLGDHCLALRRFLLLGQGDFVESLMDLAEAELSRDAAQLFRHQLVGVLDMALRQSNAQFCPPDTLARLTVKLMSPSSGEKGWDIFLLDYAIDSPLHVVFSPKPMEQYYRAFSFLWKLRRVSHALASCWSQHMALHRHLASCSRELPARAADHLFNELRQTLFRCGSLRNEMHHFVQNVQSYVMCGVLESSWAKLQAGWAKCTDLDEVILEHQRYLSYIEEGAFLSPETVPVHQALTMLFDLALNFTELHDQVCASAFEAVDVLSREPDGPLPFARSLAECRASLGKIGSQFLVRFQSLVKTLEERPSLRQLETDVRFLLCRLDFNGYYEEKRAQPWGRGTQMGRA
mmetsp:Transcript_129338/g.234997  ORF Transcript_129338/g.234997 Transcript_129338/m.234997 type:complete len:864 (-) Transcript_129338:60-2651(-)